MIEYQDFINKKLKDFKFLKDKIESYFETRNNPYHFLKNEKCNDITLILYYLCKVLSGVETISDSQLIVIQIFDVFDGVFQEYLAKIGETTGVQDKKVINSINKMNKLSVLNSDFFYLTTLIWLTYIDNSDVVVNLSDSFSQWFENKTKPINNTYRTSYIKDFCESIAMLGGLDSETIRDIKYFGKYLTNLIENNQVEESKEYLITFIKKYKITISREMIIILIENMVLKSK
ncbi:hypothetical protein PPL_07281 [Heterostelium album PN500]|uniref:Uncharacterized protein n=1 Tax=Heterostelium pallidum (strain ATCC 26659 / Pp 5 / PN500) TaxID=670386 RepID=D3BEW5_HETP5|nr:hypothetical protein PPL_07281 [Heterostelium album PN500]EFA80446.1 hypothetical protein PPL_07281 [Heterostelium album PN500]|eukprot:XP_020432566.1 hypothetical protein PPL_07281 [Heterostelium album PN500]